jgi:hypothetical protein
MEKKSLVDPRHFRKDGERVGAIPAGRGGNLPHGVQQIDPPVFHGVVPPGNTGHVGVQFVVAGQSVPLGEDFVELRPDDRIGRGDVKERRGRGGDVEQGGTRGSVDVLIEVGVDDRQEGVGEFSLAPHDPGEGFHGAGMVPPHHSRPSDEPPVSRSSQNRL